MRKVLLISSFFLSTLALLISSVVYLSFLSSDSKNIINLSLDNTAPVAYAALPTLDSQISDSVSEQDSRVEIVRNFFEKYKSPLVPYAEDVIKYADMYGMDYRLIPAIGMQESNLCKKAPAGSFNCWGFGIYAHKVQTFSDYSEAIQVITRYLSIHYKGKGLETPEEIMSKYTPSSKGSWADGVNQFMAELK